MKKKTKKNLISIFAKCARWKWDSEDSVVEWTFIFWKSGFEILTRTLTRIQAAAGNCSRFVFKRNNDSYSLRSCNPNKQIIRINYTHTRKYVPCIHIYVCVCAREWLCACTHTHAHSITHTHIHKHTHTMKQNQHFTNKICINYILT